MHMMKTYENLCPRLERELVEVCEKKEWTREDVEDLHHILKSIYLTYQLEEKEMMNENGMSGAYYNDAYSGRSMRIPNMSMENMSYGRWGRDGDGDGRYSESSRDNFRDSSYRGSNGQGYSNGYSRDNANRKMVQKLETLKDDTMSERERVAIDNCIKDISRVNS